MKLKRFATVILISCVTLFTAHEAQAFYNPSTGRWLSRDPLEEKGGVNLHAPMSNDPINRFDFLGEYEIDFHFYAIYYLARAKCFSDSYAYSVAHDSQAVDDDFHTNPIRLGFDAAFGDEIAAGLLRDYHFWDSSKTVGTKRNPSVLAARILAHRWVWTSTFGSLLHTYADSWAHEDFTAWPSKPINYRTGSTRGAMLNYVGHVDAPEGGHAPDYPYNNVDKAVDAAMHIFDILNKSPGCTCDYGLPRSKVQSDLRSVFAYHSDLNNRVRLFQSLIKSRFGDNVSYTY